MRTVEFRVRRVLAVFLAAGAACVVASMWPAAASDAVGEYCYVVADHTHAVWDDDMLSRVDTGVFSPTTNETTIGTMTGLNIEAVALKPNTRPPVLYATSGGTLGTLGTSNAVFTRIGSLGSGTGSLGTIQFSDTDGLTFDPHTGRLYASIRRSGSDLLVEVNPTTGARVAGAFGAGKDYVVVQPINGLADIDDISIGGRVPDVAGNRFPMWAIANQDGNNPRLIKINRSGDTFTGATTDVGATLVKDIEGLSWGNTGLWATTGKSNNVEGLWQMNPTTGLATNPRILDNATDYESLACPPPATLEVTVGPKSGLNQTTGQHSFTVSVTKDDEPAPDVVPSIDLSGVGSVVHNGCASGTDANGVCAITVTSGATGLTTLAATVTTSVGQSTLATDTDSGSTQWIALEHTAACQTAPVGALVPYTLSFDVSQDMSNVTVTDTLPSQLVFQSAGAINGVAPVTPVPNAGRGGAISWTFPTLRAGHYSSVVTTRVAVDVPNGTDIINEVAIAQAGHSVELTRAIRVGQAGVLPCALPLQVTVAPKLGLNLLQSENTFTVTVLRDGVPAAGVRPNTDLVSTGSIRLNSCADGTDASGTCKISVHSLLAGTGVLTATYEIPVGDGRVSATDAGSMVWIGLDKGLPCLGAPLGALVPYTVTFTVGDDLTDVTLTDRLPDELVFQSANAINGVAAVGPQPNQAGGGTVRWTFDELPAGTYTGRVFARIGLGVLNNTRITNVASFSHGGQSVERSRTVDVLDLGLDKGLPEMCPLPLQLTVLPKLGLDLFGDEHVFTVDVLLDGEPAEGLKPEVQVLGTGTIHENRCASVGTDAAGRCTVTLKSALPGTALLTASYEIPIADRTLRVTDVGTMVWVGLSKDTLCPLTSAPPTTPIPYRVSFTVGDDLTDVTVIDRLPSQLRFVSAGSINGVAAVTPSSGDRGGTVTWTFSRLPAGEYSALINVVLAAEALPGLEVTNVVELVHGELSVRQSHELTVIRPDSVTDALAFGVKARLPGVAPIGRDVAPTPTTEGADHAELASVPNPITTNPLVRSLQVSEFDTSTPGEASSTAIATAGTIDANIPGVVRVQADGAISRSTSVASLVNATSTAAGSTVKNLRINGAPLGDVSEPTSMVIRDPITRAAIAEVRVLERIASWAAANEKQPADGFFRSGLEVNAIHVIAYDQTSTPSDEAADLIIGHTQSLARFTSGIGCLDDLLKVIGRGVVAHLFGVSSETPHAVIGDVRLPRTGGSESEHVAQVDLPTGTAGASTSSTSGVVSVADQRAESNARARVTDLALAGGAIRADLIEAITRADLSSPTGEAKIAHLVVAGAEMCPSACSPAPNTAVLLPGVLVMLNEQMPSAGGITVNAVHVYVLGGDNALGLPAGAELVIGQATSGAARG